MTIDTESELSIHPFQLPSILSALSIDNPPAARRQHHAQLSLTGPEISHAWHPLARVILLQPSSSTWPDWQISSTSISIDTRETGWGGVITAQILVTSEERVRKPLPSNIVSSTTQKTPGCNPPRRQNKKIKNTHVLPRPTTETSLLLPIVGTNRRRSAVSKCPLSGVSR